MVKVYEVGEVYFDGKTPVPSYEEWKELKEQRDWYETRTYERAALINELREQLNEANEALKKAKEKALSVELSGLDYDNRHKMYDIMFADGIIDSYLEKWGVK